MSSMQEGSGLAAMEAVLKAFKSMPRDERRERLSEFQNKMEVARPATFLDAETYRLEQELIALTK